MTDILDLFLFVKPYLKAILVLLVAFFAVGLINRQTKKLLKTTVLPVDIQNLLRNIIVCVLWIAVLMYVMGELKLEQILMPLIGASFLVGAAVALAVKDVLGDAIAGLFLLLDRHFDVGDEIETMNYRGEIVEVTLRKTRIRTSDVTVVILPNGKIDSAGWVLHEKKIKQKV